MKKQVEYFGAGSTKNLHDILYKETVKKVFIVTGKKSFVESGGNKIFADLSDKFLFTYYNDFSENPRLEELEKGISAFRESGSELIIAFGGGSVIDTAKLINILSAQNGNPDEYIKNKKTLTEIGKKMIAIPTTSGSGSESTHFAVVYSGNQKYSLAHEYILPDIIIINPELTYSLSSNHTAVSGIDAFSQAVESYWSVNSNQESKKYSSESIKLILENLVSAVNNPSPENRINMSKAANLAGKAINITKTTAPHAISYSLTTYFGVPHGQAVSFTLGEFFVYNYEVTSEDAADSRGAEYVKKTITEINGLMGCNTAEESKNKINNLLKSVNLKTKLKEADISSESDLKMILENVNTERLQNNPRKLSSENLMKILKSIL